MVTAFDDPLLTMTRLPLPLSSAVPPHRGRAPARGVVGLVAVLLLTAGCAYQPYPDVPGGAGGSVAADSPSASSGRPAPGMAGEPEDYSNAPVSDIAKLEAGLPPVSQKVDPLPPDPASLPEAAKRQLDIRLASQRFNYFENDQLVWTGLISSGAAQYPTPKGSFRVQSKDRYKRSGSYTNFFNMPTPMPYALQFKGPYYIHEGYLPGIPASHGCVRLRYEDARFLFERMRVGDWVVVAD